MDEFVAKLNEYMALAEQAVVEVAPEVWEATMFIIRLQGVGNIVVGFLFLTAAFVPLIWRKKIWARVKELEAKASPYDQGLWTALTIASHFAQVGSGAIGICWMSWDEWLAVFSPEARLVYNIGQSAGVF